MPSHVKILLVLIYIARQLLLVRARVVKSVDTADLKSADSKKSCRFDSGLGHQVLMIFTHPFHSSRRLMSFVGLAIFSSAISAETLSFNCIRAERDMTEEYVLKVAWPTEGSKSTKGKVYFDERDLDQVSSGGLQEIKNVSITKDKISFLTDTSFPPEEFDGVRYGAGTVVSLTTINRVTGELKKIETIKGGILASTMGEGTKSYTEKCSPLKGN